MPMIEFLIIHIVNQYLKYLSNNLNIIDEQFTFFPKSLLEEMKKLIKDYNIRVRLGYPRDATSLPCIVVTIDSETEEGYSLGDGIDLGYDDLDDNYLKWDKDKKNYIREHTQMKANLRCEVRSDNATVTSFLYSIVKLALLSTRFKLTNYGVMLPQITGGDLEPGPEYITDTFVYRKAVIMTCSYDVDYYVQELIAGKPNSQFNIGTDIDDIEINISEGGINGEHKD